MSAYTPACLAWHVLFNVSGFSRFEEWQFKGCQLLMARYCAACMASWVPRRQQLRQPVFQRKYATDVGRRSKHKNRLMMTDVTLLTWSKGQGNWNQRIVWISWLLHFISSETDLRCQMKKTSQRNVNNATLHFTFHNHPVQLLSSKKTPTFTLKGSFLTLKKRKVMSETTSLISWNES